MENIVLNLLGALAILVSTGLAGTLFALLPSFVAQEPKKHYYKVKTARVYKSKPMDLYERGVYDSPRTAAGFDPRLHPANRVLEVLEGWDVEELKIDTSYTMQGDEYAMFSSIHEEVTPGITCEETFEVVKVQEALARSPEEILKEMQELLFEEYKRTLTESMDVLASVTIEEGQPNKTELSKDQNNTVAKKKGKGKKPYNTVSRDVFNNTVNKGFGNEIHAK